MPLRQRTPSASVLPLLLISRPLELYSLPRQRLVCGIFSVLKVVECTNAATAQSLNNGSARVVAIKDGGMLYLFGSERRTLMICRHCAWLSSYCPRCSREGWWYIVPVWY